MSGLHIGNSNVRSSQPPRPHHLWAKLHCTLPFLTGNQVTSSTFLLWSSLVLLGPHGSCGSLIHSHDDAIANLHHLSILTDSPRIFVRGLWSLFNHLSDLAGYSCSLAGGPCCLASRSKSDLEGSLTYSKDRGILRASLPLKPFLSRLEPASSSCLPWAK